MILQRIRQPLSPHLDCVLHQRTSSREIIVPIIYAIMEGSKPESLDKVEKSASSLEEFSKENNDEFYVDHVKDVKLLAKFSLAFTSVIMLVYFSCFLDRSNIGLRYFQSTLLPPL